MLTNKILWTWRKWDYPTRCEKLFMGMGPADYQGTENRKSPNHSSVSTVDAIGEIKLVLDYRKWALKKCSSPLLKKNMCRWKHYTEVGHIINASFEEYGRNLTQPTLSMDTVVVSHWLRRMTKIFRFTDRFELFIMTKEYNAFLAELNWSNRPIERFEAQARAQRIGDDEATELTTIMCSSLSWYNQQEWWESVLTVLHASYWYDYYPWRIALFPTT